MEFTFLMPCLNEAHTLPLCIGEAQSAIDRLGLDAEILIADNCSTDGSAQIAVDCGARVVTVPDEGYGAALIGGIAAASGKYIIMGDCDGSYDFAHPDAFIEKLRAGAALIVAGLSAYGTTEVTGIEYIDRGYEYLEQKLTAVGADIHRVGEN